MRTFLNSVVAKKRNDLRVGRSKEIKAVQYETPTLLLVGPASSLILGTQPSGSVDRFPESNLRKGLDAEVEGLDD